MIGNQTLGASTFGKQNVVDPTIPVLASAASISPLGNITRITGAVTIGTIVLPTPFFIGPIYILNTDASVGVWDTSGNIALGGTFTRFKVFAFMYDRATAKWYPLHVS